MSFTTDKQTLDDLNLPGRYKSNSILNLFDHTRTRGGGQLLESMFQHPLTDALAIHTRSSIFRFFQTLKLDFPFSRETCEQAEQYMSGVGSSNLPATAWSITRKKLMKTLASGKEYELIHDGILSMITFLNRMKELFALISSGYPGKGPANPDSPYHNTIRETEQILSHAGLRKLLSEQGTTQLSTTKLIQYDHLLRHSCHREILRMLEILYEIDVYITVSGVAEEKGFIWAKALPFEEGKNRIDITGVRHPQLPGAVANNVHTSYERNLIFLTGANMAGKSTFMKSFGIAVYLAHMGFPVAAEQMTFSVQDGIFTSINVSDNLDMGYSHFYAEVLRVKKVAEEVSLSKNLVIIFDELFKGTNVKDAFDATVAVTAAFGDNPNCTFIVSTHIVEAGQVLQEQHPNMLFVYLPTIMEKQVPRYTYRLEEGISSDRHGMMIITNEGIIDIIRNSAPQSALPDHSPCL